MDPTPQKFVAARPDWPQLRSWSHPYRYINSLLHQTVASMAAQLDLGEASRIVDFGCGHSPYRSSFPASAQYLAADLPGNPDATLVLEQGWRLPLADAEADAVLSTQVLEHVPEPAQYLRECRRVLKPGGRLLLTTHGLMIHHRDPVDYWRWTGEGLQHVLAQAGFTVERFEGLMGLSAASVQLFQDASARRLPRWLQSPYVWLLQSLAGAFDRLHSPASRALNALVYAAVAVKPR